MQFQTGSPVLPLGEFLAKYVDAYLLPDLKRLGGLGDSPDSGQPLPGLCLFPHLQTIISACEMLGRVGGGNLKKHAFTWFFTRMYSGKLSAEACGEFYRTVRNGMMHTWLPNASIEVHRN